MTAISWTGRSRAPRHSPPVTKSWAASGLVRRAACVAAAGLCSVAFGPGPAAAGTVTGPIASAVEGQAESPNDDEAPPGDLEGRIQILGIDEQANETSATPGTDVTLEVAVPPSIGRVVLTEDGFAVTDGGRLVDVVVTPVATAADTVIALDVSGSMRGSALAAAKTAAGRFVDALPEDTRVGLISFGDEVEIHRSPTLDRAGLLADLEELEAGGDETVLWDGLTAAADLVSGPAAENPSIVVLSDGDDTNSTIGPADIVRNLDPEPIVLYAVAIESSDTNLADLEETVDLLSGQFLATTDIDQLGPLYADIAGRLANRYELRFRSTGEGERALVVSVATDTGIATARASIGSGASNGSGGATDPAGGPAPAAPPPVLNLDDQPVLGVVGITEPGPLADPTTRWIGLGAFFGALVLVALNLSRPRTTVSLNAVVGADRLGGVNARLGQSVERMMSSNDRGRRLDARLEAADLNLRPGEFVLAWLLGTGAVCIAITMMAGLILGVLVVLLSIAGALVLLNIRAERRRSRFADQLTDTLGIMASSLRSGQSLPRAVELVASEAPSPTAEEFHRISFEVRVGRDLTDSIRDAADRVSSPDLEWLAQAVDINRELGGDLTEILDNVASTIRERRTVARQIDALSAEGRASAWVLLSMPVLLFLFSWWRTPDNINTMLSEPIGRLLLLIALSGMGIGHFWIRHMVKPKF